MERLDPEERPLFDALDAAGFAYTIRRTRAGVPYAGLQWDIAPSRPLRSFTILRQGGTLQLTTYDPLGARVVLDASTCLARQAALPLARLYVGDDPDRKLELSIGLPLDGVTLDALVLRELLTHLGTSAEAIAGTAADVTLPRLPGAAESLNLPVAFHALQLTPKEEGARWALQMGLPGLPVDGRFVASVPRPGWLLVEAELVGDDRLARLAPDLLNRLQCWAPVGRFVQRAGQTQHGASSIGHGQLGCEVSSPGLGRPSADLLAATLRAAVRLLGTAFQRAGDPSRAQR